MNANDKSQKNDRQELWSLIRCWYIMSGMTPQAAQIIKTFEDIERAAAREGYQAGFRDGSKTLDGFVK